jgi:hypothetical protein
MIGPGMIRVSAAMPLPSVMRDFGIPLEPVLSDFGIRSDIFGYFENVIPYATLCRLASRARVFARSSGMHAMAPRDNLWDERICPLARSP